MNLKAKINKLQLFLAMNGVELKINTYQHYSQEHNRMKTTYCVCTPYYDAEHQKMKNKQLFSTGSQIDIIQIFAMMATEIMRVTRAGG